MKPRAFDYVRPDTVAEAVDLLAEYGEDARILAGGQSLMAIMNLRMAEPKVLIDIGGHKDFKGIKVAGGFLEVGASVTQNELMSWPDLAKTCAAAGEGAAVGRPLPDAQSRHRLRLALPRRSVVGDPAVARHARRRGGAALEARRARRGGRGVPDRHALDRRASPTR